jgi:two-component system nitrogen regulation sensor histidine kinase GlnL
MIDFNHVWNTIPFPAFIINSEFKIIEGNSSAEQIIHTSRNQMFGKELGVFFGINSVVLETVKQVRQQNSSLSQYGVEISTIDRVSFECNLHINPLDKNNDKYLLIIQPNSFAQKINQSSTQRTTARSVTAMASMLAHEIRNPLAGISGAAQLLAMNANDDDC